MKILLKTGILLVIIANFLFLMSGCAGFKDIDRRFFVAGIGIDKAVESGQSYRITLKLAIPNPESKKGGSEFVTFTEESASIAEAVRIIKSKVDKELDFGQMKIILFGEDISSEDILPAVDWFLRRRDIQKIALMGIGKPSARDILEIKPKYESQPSDVLISSLSGLGTESNYITLEYLFDFYRRITELGIDPVLPIIEKDKENLKIDELALFKKENILKVQVALAPEETKLYNLISRQKAEASLKIEAQESTFIINTQNVKSSYKINPPNIQFKVKIAGIIEESSKAVNPGELKRYEELASEVMKSKILQLLEKIRNEEVDPIGMGLHFRSRSWDNDTKWENWKKLYPKLQFTADVDVKIVSTGLIK